MARRRSWTTSELAEGVRAGDKRALARALSVVERGGEEAEQLVRELHPSSGAAYTIGVTGPPGVGKSTLIGALVTHVRALGRSVGVVSVDPSSPFSKGALLGDRIRLSEHFLDPEVFIRSMGTRGHSGGLAEATLEALLVLDAGGRELLFVETAGVGQSEVAIAGLADTVVLVLMPGSGDSVQALKAGVMEIPDVIVLNKSDHASAAITLAELRQAVSLGAEAGPPIVSTRASDGNGVDVLWRTIEEHREALKQSGELELRRRENLRRELLDLAASRMRRELEQACADDPKLDELINAVAERRLDPLSAVRELRARLG
ncbi:MAG TPA: methylmalonyl Co-A mutase-associated GTPase MeaB [Gaiellaceae bacterium]